MQVITPPSFMTEDSDPYTNGTGLYILVLAIQAIPDTTKHVALIAPPFPTGTTYGYPFNWTITTEATAYPLAYSVHNAKSVCLIPPDWTIQNAGKWMGLKGSLVSLAVYF